MGELFPSSMERGQKTKTHIYNGTEQVNGWIVELYGTPCYVHSKYQWLRVSTTCTRLF